MRSERRVWWVILASALFAACGGGAPPACTPPASCATNDLGPGGAPDLAVPVCVVDVSRLDDGCVLAK